MSALILRHNWTRQPQVPVGINWDNPSSDKLLWLINPATGLFYDAVSGVHYSPTTVTKGFLSNQRINTFSNKFESATFPRFPVGSDVSVLINANPTATTAALFCQRLASDNNHIEIRAAHPDAGKISFRASSGARANISICQGAATLDGRWHSILGTATVDTVLSKNTENIYINGVQGQACNSGSSLDSTAAVAFAGLSGSTAIPYSRGMGLCAGWLRALSADEARRLYLNPWQLLRLMQRRLWVVGEASAGTDNLTATDLVTGSPVLGTPALGQAHALTATGITTSAPALGSPALGQVHGLVATALAVSAPVLGTPAIGQAHALTASGLTVEGPVLGAPTLAQIHALVASGLTTSAPELGAPALGQIHSLMASDLTVSSPVLGSPALTENAADVDALTANALVVGSPALGSPSLGQIHVLGCDGLVTGSPVLGLPIVRQIHTITALGLTVGAPTIGTPELNKTTIDLDITANLSSVGLDVMYLDSIGTFTAQLTSSGCKLVTLRSVGNFEVAEREE